MTTLETYETQLHTHSKKNGGKCGLCIRGKSVAGLSAEVASDKISFSLAVIAGVNEGISPLLNGFVPDRTLPERASQRRYCPSFRV